MKIKFDRYSSAASIELSKEDLLALAAAETLDNAGISIKFSDDAQQAGFLTDDSCKDHESDAYEHGRQDGHEQGYSAGYEFACEKGCLGTA